MPPKLGAVPTPKECRQIHGSRVYRSCRRSMFRACTTTSLPTFKIVDRPVLIIIYYRRGHAYTSSLKTQVCALWDSGLLGE